MKIDRIELRQINLPLISPFQSSGWTIEGNNSVIIKVCSDGITGWGESSVSKFPYYIEETSSMVYSIQKEFLVPLIFIREIEHPGDLPGIFKKVRGNKFAIAGLEMAVWDLWCKIKNQNLAKFLGGKRERIPVGVSIGITNNKRDLLKLCEMYLKEGYQRIKIKPGWDSQTVQLLFQKHPGMVQ